MRHFLKDTISERITIDHFSPKSGDESEIVVIAFYLVDKEPAEDLETFLQRSPVDIVDVDVSPNPDENGYYLVFVELEKHVGLVEDLSFLIKEVENVSGELDWKVKPYLSVDWYSLDDPEFLKYFIPDDSAVDVNEFFDHTMSCKVRVDEHTIQIGNLSAEIVKFGKFKDISNEPCITESISSIVNPTSEVRALCETIGGRYEVSTNKNMCIIMDDEEKVLVLRNLTHKF